MNNETALRPTLARVRASAIEANVRRLAALADGAAFCAVVKAAGYGHGAAATARAALAGGGSWLAVATVTEALEIAEAVAGAPVLVMSELTPAQTRAVAPRLPPRVRLTVASVEGVEAAAATGEPTRRVHLKVDTGMHRMGAAPSELAAVADALRRAGPRLHLEGVWTHFSVADAPGDPFTAEQSRRFEAALATLRRSGLRPEITHAANSAALLAHPQTRRDLVRVGIAMYGVAPSPELEGAVELEPALDLVSQVTAVRTVAPGESVSYGRHWYAEAEAVVATVPIGYADGIRRHSGPAGVEVLVRGRRCPIVGAVTMDQLMVAAHHAVAEEIAVGDEVVLLGRQGAEQITATEVAGRLGTIAYEVLTGLSPRVRRQTV